MLPALARLVELFTLGETVEIVVMTDGVEEGREGIGRWFVGVDLVGAGLVGGRVAVGESRRWSGKGAGVRVFADVAGVGRFVGVVAVAARG